jgi:hypothetical protein
VISTLYRQASERGFDSLLSAHLFNLIGSVGVSEGGQLTGAPDLGDLRFSEPNSGWYWSVEPASEGVHGELHSSSMTKATLSPSVADVPFNASFQRSYAADGINGEQLEVFESEFVLDAKNRAARFRQTVGDADGQLARARADSASFTMAGPMADPSTSSGWIAGT